MHRSQIIASRFELEHLAGEGGMGTVWVAEQTEPVRRPGEGRPCGGAALTASIYVPRLQ